MEQDTQKHIALMAAATSKLTEELKLVKKEMESQREHFELKLWEKEEQIKSLETKLQLGQKIEPIQLGILPFDISFTNYKEVKMKNELMDSPPMFTHPGGYKINLRVRPNGFLSGKGTHVSVWFNSLKSDHDGVLKIPIKFTITLQLLNQHKDETHLQRDIKCEITQEKAGTWRYIGAEWELIRHEDLEWDSKRETQYLKNNCLKFRITKIVVH